jgi:hypothetical protein
MGFDIIDAQYAKRSKPEPAEVKLECCICGRTDGVDMRFTPDHLSYKPFCIPCWCGER